MLNAMGCVGFQESTVRRDAAEVWGGEYLGVQYLEGDRSQSWSVILDDLTHPMGADLRSPFSQGTHGN